MYKLSSIHMILLLIPFVASGASTPFLPENGCLRAVKTQASASYTLHKAETTIAGQKLHYLYTTKKGINRGKAYGVSKLFPNEDPFIFGFDGAHTFIYFHGLLFDSSGRPPIHVWSNVEEIATIKGNLIFAIKNYPPDLKERLVSIVENYSELSAATCVKVSCTFLQAMWPELNFPLTHDPMVVIDQLLKFKTEHSESMDIVVLGGNSFKMLVWDIILAKGAFIGATSIVAGAFLAVLATLTFF